MPLFSHMIGWSAFGLASRLWQLGIQQRPLATSLFTSHFHEAELPLTRFYVRAIDIPATGAVMAAFGGFGYYSFQWQEWCIDYLAQQRVRIEKVNEDRKQRKLEQEAVVRAHIESRQASNH